MTSQYVFKFLSSNKNNRNWDFNSIPKYSDSQFRHSPPPPPPLLGVLFCLVGVAGDGALLTGSSSHVFYIGIGCACGGIMVIALSVFVYYMRTKKATDDHRLGWDGCLFVCLSVSIGLCDCLCLSLCLSVSISLCDCLCLSVSMNLCGCLCLSVCVYRFLWTCFSLCLCLCGLITLSDWLYNYLSCLSSLVAKLRSTGVISLFQTYIGWVITGKKVSNLSVILN